MSWDGSKINDYWLSLNENHFLILSFFELGLYVYTVMALSYLIHDFLMPCLKRIAKKFDMNQYTTGFLIALGNSIPELCTNAAATFSSSSTLADFGLGAIFGSGIFDFTVCVAFCCICSKFVHGEEHLLNIMAITKDVLVYLLTIVLLRFLVRDHEIDLVDSILLFLLFPCYIILNSILNQSNWFNDHCDKINMITLHSKGEILPMSSFEYDEITLNNSGDRSQDEDNEDEEEKLMSAVLYKPRPNGKENSEKDERKELFPFEFYMNQGIKLSKEQQKKSPRWNPSQEEIKELEENQLNKSMTEYDSTIRPLANVFTHTLLRPLGVLYSYTIPMKYPLVAFPVCLFFLFLFTQYTMFSVEQLSVYMGVSVTFVGLVFTSWGNNVGDLTTTIVSAKSKMAGQATSSLFGSQIINIQISLGVPWLVKNLIYGPVKLNDPNIPSSIEAIICVLFAMYLILVLGKMRLSYCNGLLILIVYFLYVFYEINQNWGDPAALGKSRGRIPGNSRGRRPHQKNPTLHLQN